MKKLILVLFFFASVSTYAQFTKDKMLNVLCGTDQKTWQVSGTNIERPEKTMTFKNDYSGNIENQAGVKKPIKWSLQSSDNIRWFIDIGGTKYESIVSYNKKGEQYLKLTHGTGGDKYEIKLNQIN